MGVRDSNSDSDSDGVNDGLAGFSRDLGRLFGFLCLVLSCLVLVFAWLSIRSGGFVRSLSEEEHEWRKGGTREASSAAD